MSAAFTVSIDVPGSVHLDLEVADIETAVERAVAAGAVVERRSSDAAWGHIATLADPFGHGFCLIEPPAR